MCGHTYFVYYQYIHTSKLFLTLLHLIVAMHMLDISKLSYYDIALGP